MLAELSCEHDAESFPYIHALNENQDEHAGDDAARHYQLDIQPEQRQQYYQNCRKDRYNRQGVVIKKNIPDAAAGERRFECEAKEKVDNAGEDKGHKGGFHHGADVLKDICARELAY